MNDGDSKKLDEVLAGCFAQAQQGDADAFRKACAEHPSLASEIADAEAALRDLSSFGSGGPPASAPTQIGRFAIAGVLGRGGMGVVYRAHCSVLGRDVALKVLPRAAESGESLARFEREARALAKVKHRNVVRVLEAGQSAEGIRWFAMELIEGASLAAILAKLAGRSAASLVPGDLLPPDGALDEGVRSYTDAAVAVARKIAEALEDLHRVGVVHRDVKPSNILIDRHGEPFLTDFGVARGTGDATVTRTGRHPGTPAYMAPEQIDGSAAPVGPAADVYALGVTLYEMLTLRRPFGGASSEEVFRRIATSDPVPPRRINRAIPRDLETICLCAIEKEPRRRYATAQAFAEDLRRLQELRPIAARPPGPVTAVVKLARRRPWIAAVAGMALLAVLGLVGRAIDRSLRTARYLREIDAARGELESPDADLASVATHLANAAQQHAADDQLSFLFEELSSRAACAERRSHENDAGHAVEAFVALAPAAAIAGYPAVLNAVHEMSARDPDNPALVGIYRQLFAAHWKNLRAQEPRAEGANNAATHPDRVALTLEGAPAGARVHLFRFETVTAPPGTERMVAMPVGADGPVERVRPLVGRFALTVEQAQGGSAAAATKLERGDLIFAVDGVPIGGAVVVVALAPRGGAACAGVHSLDRLVRLQDRDVESSYDVEEFLSKHAASDRVDATFLHAGRPIGATIAASELAKEVDAVTTVFDRSIEGDCEIEVVSAGASRREVIPAGIRSGLRVCTTSDPLVICPENLAGTTPMSPVELTSGSYLLLLRHAGAEDLRLLVAIADQPVVVNAAMLPDGTTPQGMVWIPPGPFIAGGDPAAEPPRPAVQEWLDGYWIGRTEVTAAEYAAFLNDPETIARVVRSERRRQLILVPRDGVVDDAQWPIWRAVWKRGADGLFHCPSEPDQPITRISCSDADAYCAWRNRKALERNEPFFFRLPTEDEWEKAARGVDGRPFEWGDTFDPRLCLTSETRSKPQQVPERVLRFLTDESPFGVHDMAGNLLEWCVGGYHSRFDRPWRGGLVGANGEKSARAFRVATGQPGLPWRAAYHDGFRVVAWRRAVARG